MIFVWHFLLYFGRFTEFSYLILPCFFVLFRRYALSSGDHGVIRTLEVPVYITRAHQGVLHCLDREHKVRSVGWDEMG